MSDSFEDDRHLDLLGRISALETLLTRVASDVAKLHPGSTTAWMLKNIETVVGSVKNGMPPGLEHMSVVIEPHLRRYLEKADDLRRMQKP